MTTTQTQPPPSTADDERKPFEAWLGRESFTERSDSGKYVSAHVDAMWSAWQARAALSIGDARDAKRYRWLREQDWAKRGLCVVASSHMVKLGADCPTRDRLDAAIDAALSTEHPSEPVEGER